MTPEQKNEVRAIIKEELQEFLGSDRFIFPKTIQVLNGRNIQLGRGTGTKIGTAADQKLAFYGSTPLVQQTGVAVTAGGIHAALVSLGLITA